MPAIQRAGHIRAVAAKLREHKTRLARRIAMEQGKILPLAEVEIDFTASYMDYLDHIAKRARRGYPSESSPWCCYGSRPDPRPRRVGVPKQPSPACGLRPSIQWCSSSG